MTTYTSLIPRTRGRDDAQHARKRPPTSPLPRSSGVDRPVTVLATGTLGGVQDAGRIRTQCFMGAMLEKMPGHGSHGGDRHSSSIVELENIGVGKTQSHRLQTMAGVRELNRRAIVPRTNLTEPLIVPDQVGVLDHLGL